MNSKQLRDIIQKEFALTQCEHFAYKLVSKGIDELTFRELIATKEGIQIRSHITTGIENALRNIRLGLLKK